MAGNFIERWKLQEFSLPKKQSPSCVCATTKSRSNALFSCAVNFREVDSNHINGLREFGA